MSETFRQHSMGCREIEYSESIRDAAENLEGIIALRCKPSREKSLAMTKLEECVMWANKALAIHGGWDGEQ